MIHSPRPVAAPSTARLAWHRAITAWSAYLRSGDKSPATIKAYTGTAARLADALGCAPERVSHTDLTGWLGNPRWSPASRYAYRKAVVGFYSWAADEYGWPDPSRRLATVHVPAPNVLPAEESAIAAVLAGPDPLAAMIAQLGAWHGVTDS